MNLKLKNLFLLFCFFSFLASIDSIAAGDSQPRGLFPGDGLGGDVEGNGASINEAKCIEKKVDAFNAVKKYNNCIGSTSGSAKPRTCDSLLDGANRKWAICQSVKGCKPCPSVVDNPR